MADILCDGRVLHRPRTNLLPSSHLTFPYLKANGEDQIAPLIRLAAEKYRHSSLEKFPSDLTIRNCAANYAFRTECNIYLHPPTWCRSVRDSKNGFLGWEFYYFDIPGAQHDPVPLEVRLLTPHASKHGNHPHLPGIRIRYKNVWLKVSTFLDHYPPARDIRAWALNQQPESLWDSQWRWWVALSRLPTLNPLRRTFRLLDLPGEIREIVYAHIISSPYQPYPRIRARRLHGLHRDRFFASQPDLRVMLLNKQVHAEICRVLLKDTPWFIPHHNVLDRILTSEYFCMRVQRIHLALSHGQFLALFAPNSSAFVVGSLRPLRWMKLRELILDFAPPPSPRLHWDQHGTQRRTVVCQRIIVAWILNAAEYWVVGHEGVTVIGWVREKQKRDFERLCNEGLRELARWREMDCVDGKELWDWDAWREDGNGVRLAEEGADDETLKGKKSVDGKEVVPELRMLTDHDGPEPPACFCDASCATDEWSPLY